MDDLALMQIIHATRHLNTHLQHLQARQAHTFEQYIASDRFPTHVSSAMLRAHDNPRCLQAVSLLHVTHTLYHKRMHNTSLYKLCMTSPP